MKQFLFLELSMFGFPISLDCRGAVWGERASGTCTCFQHFIKPLDLQPLAQRLYIWRQYINLEKIKLQSIQVSKLVIPAIIYLFKYYLYKLDNYVIYIIIQIRQLYKLGCFILMSL